jgi:hypothetical protein
MSAFEKSVSMIALRCGFRSSSAFCIASSSAGFFVLTEYPRYLSALPWMSESYLIIVVLPEYLAASAQSSFHVVGRSGMRSFR